MTVHSHRFGDPAFQAFVLELRDEARRLYRQMHQSSEA